MNRFPITAVGAAFLLGATAAHAQTRVTQEITNEPVATTITQTPNGTVITRWPLQTIPEDTPAVIVPTPGRVAGDEQIVEPWQSLRNITPHRTGRSETRTHAARDARRLSTRTSSKTIRRSFAAVPHAHAPAPLALTRTQRHIVYRTIVLRDVLPPPVGPVGPVVTAPALVPAPVAAPAPAFDADNAPGTAYINTYSTPTYPGATYADSYAPAYVGTQVPGTVRLVPLPSTLAGEVPVLQPYRYAVLNDRVLLVDPATNIVVADVTND
jgi:hypothetical protein